MDNMKRQNDMTMKDELTRSVGAQYATGDQWRNNSRKNEGMEPKQKQHPVMDVTVDRSKIWCCKEQYCIGTWNVRSMNQGKLEVVEQEMARVNVDILGISELKWAGMGEMVHSRSLINICLSWTGNMSCVMSTWNYWPRSMARRNKQNESQFCPGSWKLWQRV